MGIVPFMPLRLVLMGTGEFAAPVFRAFMSSRHSVVALFTQPDRQGRGHHRHINPLKVLAVERGIPVFQPERVNHSEVLAQLGSLQADMFFVAAYGQILKPELLAIPRLGAFNLHGSLLPRHRGAAPVQYSIWMGDETTGVTIFRIEPALDSGPIVAHLMTQIAPDETAGELMQRLAELAVPLSLEATARIETGTAELRVQDTGGVTLAPKIRREQGVIDWSASVRQIDCLVRAMQPWPKGTTWLLHPAVPPLRCIVQRISATAVEDAPAGLNPGQIVAIHGRLLVQTGNGLAEILRIQPEGRSSMTGQAFLNGHSICAGGRFGADGAVR